MPGLPSRTLRPFLIAASILVPAAAHAYPDGLASSCTGCHPNSGAGTTVDVATGAVHPGQVVPMHIEVCNPSTAYPEAGFWIELTAGTSGSTGVFGPAGSGVMRLSDRELVQSTPRGGKSGDCWSWTNEWTAPAATGTVTWSLWGIAVNGDRNGSSGYTGDASGSGSGSIAVTLPDGATCGLDGDCDNGHCADGTCCATTCEGTCYSCATGTCEPAAPEAPEGPSECGCAPGYRFDGAACADIDECALQTDDCVDTPVDACVDSDGSFSCACPSGFEGDGHPTSAGGSGCTSVCGNGTVDPGEQCDQGAADNGADASCCDASCQLRSASHACRPAAGPCDLEETCSGDAATCPDDGFQIAGETCRPSAGTCDPPEECSGSSASCPDDVLSPPSTVCSPRRGECDVAETCDGVSAGCPPESYLPSTFVCRPAARECDLPETCTGESDDCPMDEDTCTTDTDTSDTSSPETEGSRPDCGCASSGGPLRWGSAAPLRLLARRAPPE